MRKLPHFMDQGFHKANRDNKTAAEAKRQADKAWERIYGKGETFGEIEVKKPGYVKISYGGKE